MADKINIQGFCTEQFKPVEQAFLKNFKDGLDIGACFAVTLDGKFVVDIWSGYKDASKTHPWEQNTIVNVWSTTKVMTALCTLILVDRNLLDLDAPVAKYWPEFAQEGKEKVLVRHLLSHTSGLSGFGKRIRINTLYNWERIIQILETQKPWWEAGTKCGYHLLTFGYLLGELVKRITGKTLGTFFRDEIVEFLDADFHIGLPEKNDVRVADLIPPTIDLSEFGKIDPYSIAFKSLTNPVIDPEYFVKQTKTRAWRAAEIPAANGHGNARSVAKITAVVACGGELNGVRLLSLNTIEKALEEQYYGIDLILNIPMRFGLGFGLRSKDMPIGPNERVLYWGGWGGSVSIMDLDAKLSIAYVMNKMSSGLTEDIRSSRLIEAVYNSIQ